MADLLEMLSENQKKMLVSLKKWYRHYLTMIREIAQTCTPVPKVSEFDEDELGFWFRRVQKWIAANTSEQQREMLVCNPGMEIEARYETRESNRFGSTTRIVIIKPALWNRFLDSRSDLIAEDPFFQITEPDQRIATMFIRIFLQSNVTNTIPVICKLFHLKAELFDYALVYEALISPPGSVLYQEICSIIPATDILPLRQGWCAKIAKKCFRSNRYEIVTWISRHVVFTGAHAIQMQLREATIRATARVEIPRVTAELNEITPIAA